MPFSVSVGEALKLMLSNIVIGLFSERISPSVHLHKTLDFLCSNVMLWLIWLVWSQVVLSARASVGSCIVVPLVVSVGETFEFLSSNVVVRVLTEWIGIVSLLSEG